MSEEEVGISQIHYCDYLYASTFAYTHIYHSLEITIFMADLYVLLNNPLLLWTDLIICTCGQL